MNKEKGSAIVIALIVMALLAVLITAFSQNTNIDLLISRNTRIAKQSFLWSDSGIGMAQEVIIESENTSGINEANPDMYNLCTKKITRGNLTGSVYNATEGELATFQVTDQNGNILADIDITYLTTMVNDGTSIIFGAGYEGVGKGAGAGGTIARIYTIESTGHAESNAKKKTAAVYRSVSTGN